MMRVRSFLMSLFWLAASLLATASLGEEPQDYQDLPMSKALALVPGASEPPVISHGQANDLLAALDALRACEASRLAEQPSCEIRRLNSEQVTSGAEIRARIPPGRHPLHLWRLSGPRATLYLAGSVHILKPSLYPLPVPFETAFESADHLVLEVNIGAQDPLVLRQKTLAHASLPAGQHLDEVLPEPLIARLAESLRRYGIPISQVATMNPAFVMNQVVLLRLMTLGYQAEYGIEAHFLEKVGTRNVLELETIDQQLDLLFNQPMALQRQLLVDTLDQEAGIEPLVAGLVSAWLAGDDEEFMAMFEAQSGDSELARQFTEQLLDRRNVAMVEKIKSYLKGAGTYFILVGAAHLIGDQGIVALLTDQGISAERLWSDSQFSNNQLKGDRF